MKADRILTVDFGVDGIRMAVAEPSASGLPRLTDCCRAAYDTASKLPKEAQAAMTLKQLLDEKKPGVSRAVLSIDGQAVFSRVIKLPRVGREQVEKTIRHEAVQNIPFPIDEVIWDACIFDPESDEPEVLLAAVKAELVEGLVYAVKANGLTVERITAAPAALANAASASGRADRPTLLVDSGAASTNLVFLDGPRVFFRSLPIAAGDAARLAQEIERSTAFYAGQNSGRSPEQSLEASALPGLEPGFAVCAGLACSAAFAIDFVPPAVLKERDLKRRRPLRLGVAVLLMAILAVWIAKIGRAQRAAEARSAAAAETATELERWAAELKPVEQRIDELQAEALVYTDLVRQRTFWLDRLNEIDRLLPKGMFLLRSEAIEADGLRITVMSYLDREPEGLDAVKQLRDAVRASAYFSERTEVSSRPSKKEFAREFVLDIYFSEEGP